MACCASRSSFADDDRSRLRLPKVSPQYSARLPAWPARDAEGHCSQESSHAMSRALLGSAARWRARPAFGELGSALRLSAIAFDFASVTKRRC